MRASLLLLVPVFAGLVGCLPHRAEVRGKPWKIQWVGHPSADAMDDAIADCPARRIRINRHLPADGKAEALTHELLHAINCMPDGLIHDEYMNNEDGDGCESHCGIYYLGEQWPKFAAHNKSVVNWISNHGK